MDPNTAVSLYRAAGFYLLRAPAFSIRMFLEVTEQALGGQEGDDTTAFAHACQQSSAKICEVIASSSFFRLALAVASPDLVQGLARTRYDLEQTRSKRVCSRLLRYLIRMSTRPTPFGLFAGVALGTFAEQTTVELGNPVLLHARARPDMSWLLTLIQHVEQDRELLPYLHLIANSMAYEVGSRVILPSADSSGQQEHQTISLRNLPLVQAMMAHTRQPILYTDLVHALSQEFPQAPAAQIELIIAQLLETHVLIGALRPPLTSHEPARCVAEHLPATPEAATLRADLCQVLTQITTIQQHLSQQYLECCGQAIQEVSVLQVHMVAGAQQTLQVDAALHVQTPALHCGVAEAAARAADLLLRLGTRPRGLEHLEQYRLAFVQRYGHAEVPLLHLLRVEGGLGPPPTYTHPPREYPLPQQATSPPDHSRDRVLGALLARALQTQSQEIRLTDAHLARLTSWTPGRTTPPPGLIEVFLQVQATSNAALDRGAWQQIVVSGMTFGGRALGRFLEVLGEEGQACMHAYLRAEEARFPEHLFADLNYLPSDGQRANVALHPPFHAYEIAVNTLSSRPSTQVLALEDLVVGVRAGRFYVRSLRLRKDVKVFHHSMLQVRYFPNICRFLLEIAWDGSPVPGAFDWGRLSHSPFLPRITYEQMVLSLARWQVEPTEILPQGSGKDEVRWFRGLQQWRQAWQVPRYVYVTHLDQRLLLDLEHPLLAQELRAELQACQRAGTTLHLQEMLPDFNQLWLRDAQQAPYIAELVVPLQLKPEYLEPHQAPQSGSDGYQSTYQPRVILEAERRQLPGEEWCSLKWYASSLFHEHLIAGPIQALVQEVRAKQLSHDWFYIRYCDPEPHLRLRFRALHTQQQEALLLHLLARSRQLVQEGSLTNVELTSYDREIERYGGPTCMEEIEQVFSRNSDCCVSLIKAAQEKKSNLDPLAMAVCGLDHLFDCWGFDLAARCQYARARTQPYEAMDAFRPLRETLSELLVPWRLAHQEHFLRQRAQLYEILALQEPTVSRLVSHLDALAQQEQLWSTKAQILGSLAHMQINRLLGVERAQEQKAFAFWRHTLDCLQKRVRYTTSKRT